jgi:hypothetical protein
MAFLVVVDPAALVSTCRARNGSALLSGLKARETVMSFLVSTPDFLGPFSQPQEFSAPLRNLTT